MTIRVAINGFGRIGRNILRAGWNQDDFEFVFINDLTSDDMLAYLLEHDTVHGKWAHKIETTDKGIVIDGTLVRTASKRNPAELPWKEMDIDVVLECTGVFTTGVTAGAHLEAGARKVIISAPAKDIDGTFVVGVNDHELDPEQHTIISNASCTTNCLAPTAKLLDGLVGIESGMMTTVHSYTMDQNILDAPHRKGKFRRARAAAQNMIPTTTGAAQALRLVLPELNGKIHGMAIRVPTANVSMIDLVINASRTTTVEEVNAAFEAAAQGSLKGILGVTHKPVVSSDLISDPHSTTVDLSLTTVLHGNVIKIIAWYDNEWGFSNRMLDLAKQLTG